MVTSNRPRIASNCARDVRRCMNDSQIGQSARRLPDVAVTMMYSAIWLAGSLGALHFTQKHWPGGQDCFGRDLAFRYVAKSTPLIKAGLR